MGEVSMNEYIVSCTGEDSVVVFANNSTEAEDRALRQFKTKYPTMLHIEVVAISKEK